MFPKLSAPLVKDIRTGEGLAEWILGVSVSVLGAVGDVSVTKTITTVTILAGVKALRRGLLKIVALQSGAGIGTPIAPPYLASSSGTVDALLGSKVMAPAIDPGTTDQAKS